MIRVDTALTNYMSIPQHDLISTLRNDLPLGYFGSDLDAVKRGGPGCLNSLSASISGASARVRLPCGLAAG